MVEETDAPVVAPMGSRGASLRHVCQRRVAVFGYSPAWTLPFNIAVMVIAVLQYRQMMRDAIAAETRERSRPTDLTPRPPSE